MAKRTISLTDRVLDYLLINGSITSVDAYELLGATRLATHIALLKKRGVRIKTITESGINRWGNSTHYARYYLEDRDGGKKNVCEEHSPC